MLVVLTAFGYLYLPMASRLDADNERDTLDDIYTVTTKWVYIISFPAFLLFVTFPSDVMQVFFGAEYIDAAQALPILAAGFFFSVAVGRDRETLSALGDTRVIMYANGAGFMINIILNLILIPRYSFVGASVTSMLSFGAVHAVVTFVLWYRYDIIPLSSESVRTFLALPVVLFPLVFLLSGQVTITALTILPFLIITGLVGILIVVVAGGLEPQDQVAVEFFEDTVGGKLSLIRRYLPDE